MGHIGKRRPQPPVRYDWHRWLNGQVWILRSPADFTCTVQGFLATARQAAGRAQKRMIGNVEPDGRSVRIQAHRREGQ